MESMKCCYLSAWAEKYLTTEKYEKYCKSSCGECYVHCVDWKLLSIIKIDDFCLSLIEFNSIHVK